MKIKDVKAYPVFGGRRNYLFVEVITDEGVSGIGEAGITWREKAVAEAVEHLRELVIGEDPFRTEHLWQLMYRGDFFPAQRIGGSAASAIDMALWDIKGKALGVPVYQLLGGKVRDRVVCYPHNQADGADTGSLVESCLRTKEEGWKFVRWGVPAMEPFEPRPAVLASIRQMQAVREAVGEEVEIAFDVHTRLDLPDALWLCQEVEPLRPFFIEDPLRCENPDSFKTLRPRTTAPLASGEQFSSKWEFRRLVEEEWIDYARIDLCIAGGITEARKIAGWCETHYIRIAPHNPLGPVSAAACLHLDLACPNFGVQELPRKPGELLADVFPVQVRWEDGHLLPPTTPGLGVVFDPKAAAAHPYQAGGSPRLRRADGAFTNW